MRFASLGSGSRGNALVVEVKQTRLLLDCGFGIRETVARLSRLDLQPEDLTGILITHEHADHIGGAVRFARRYRVAGVADPRHFHKPCPCANAARYSSD